MLWMHRTGLIMRRRLDQITKRIYSAISDILSPTPSELIDSSLSHSWTTIANARADIASNLMESASLKTKLHLYNQMVEELNNRARDCNDVDELLSIRAELSECNIAIDNLNNTLDRLNVSLNHMRASEKDSFCTFMSLSELQKALKGAS